MRNGPSGDWVKGNGKVSSLSSSIKKDFCEDNSHSFLAKFFSFSLIRRMSKCFQDNDALQADYFFFPTPILRKRSIASLGAKSSAMSFSAA